MPTLEELAQDFEFCLRECRYEEGRKIIRLAQELYSKQPQETGG